MHIFYLALHRYLPFRSNDVETLEIDITSNVQNILGSNGTGKSSLLRELNPKPATRTDFGEAGYKHIHLMHEGHEYRLSSDFTNSSAPHSFIKNEVELNSSGTTAIQEELVRGELGYTPQVHNTSYGEHRLSEMRAGMRETYLLTIHPCQMKLILDKHKATERKIRGFRDKLSLLYERRSALVVQLIDDTLKAELQSENTTLSNTLAEIVSGIHKITNHRQNITNTLRDVSDIAVLRSKAEQKKAERHYPLYQPIDRTLSFDHYKTIMVSELSSINTHLSGLQQQIQSITAEVDKYEEHLRESDAKTTIELIESTIQTLRDDVAALAHVVIDKPFEPYLLTKLPDNISRLTDLVSSFIGYNAPIPSMRDVQRSQNRLELQQRRLRSVEHEDHQLSKRLSEIHGQMRQQMLDNIPEGCQQCMLFKHYADGIKHLVVEEQEITTRLEQVRAYSLLLNQLISRRQERLERYNQILPHLNHLSHYLNENPYLVTPLKDLDILSTLRRNPSQLLIRVQAHYERSGQYYQRIKKQEELDKRVSEYERLKTPSEFGRQFLESILAEKQAELHKLRHVFDQGLKDQHQKQDFLQLLENYAGELGILAQEKKQLDQQAIRAQLLFDQTYCDQYLTLLNEAKSKTIIRLTEIDRILRDQDALAARYHQEVIENITVLEHEMQEHQTLETALSPTTGIPHRYMVQFINDLIDTANGFIARVFAEPFEFIPLELDQHLDYRFRMRFRDVIIPDLSRCSDAQKEIGDLAFRLAQIIQLKQTHYAIYLDEIDKTFDYYHRQTMLDLLKSLVPDAVVSQLFMINHNISLATGVQDAEVLVLNENNIIPPPVYNQHVRMKKY